LKAKVVETDPYAYVYRSETPLMVLQEARPYGLKNLNSYHTENTYGRFW